MRVFVEDGQLRPFSCVLATPRGEKTVAIRNVGQLEFPFNAQCIAEDVDHPSEDCYAAAKTLQGGATTSVHFDPSVDSVQVLLQSDGMPLNARIELVQGPNTNRQVVELYTDDGCDRPFFCFLETPGPGAVVRVINTGPIAYPITTSVVPHSIGRGVMEDAYHGSEVVMGGMDDSRRGAGGRGAAQQRRNLGQLDHRGE